MIFQNQSDEYGTNVNICNTSLFRFKVKALLSFCWLNLLIYLNKFIVIARPDDTQLNTTESLHLVAYIAVPLFEEIQ